MRLQYILTTLVVVIVATAGIYMGFINTGSDEEKSSENKDYESYNGELENLDQGYSFLNNLSLSEDMNNFSFELYNQICSENTGNIFYSPYSVFVALAMTYEGARNETAEEMQNVLNIPRNNDTILKSMETMYKVFNQNSSYNLSTANALWIKKDYHILDDYINVIKEYYHGKAEELDFSNASKAAEIINNWVENQTNNKIQDLIPPSSINRFTRLILTNAIYFKGTWQTQFDEENTTDRDFKLSDGSTIQVPTMYLSEKRFNYTETEKLQVLELPYSGGDVSMIILLPIKDEGLEDISIDSEKLSDLTSSLTSTKVDVYLPKFKLETKYGLNEVLSAMGMPEAFNPQEANFSGINREERLFIDGVIHKAFIEVEEEGTEAAAATGVIVGATSIKPPKTITFKADRPFMFIIQHKITDNILFMGKVTNPSD
ncbi:MAG: serpin family protein [Candidatus Thermoplasmatota archaeon]